MQKEYWQLIFWSIENQIILIVVTSILSEQLWLDKDSYRNGRNTPTLHLWKSEKYFLVSSPRKSVKIYRGPWKGLNLYDYHSFHLKKHLRDYMQTVTLDAWTIFLGRESDQSLKPNYYKKQCSSSSFLLTWSRYTVPKWPRSTWPFWTIHFRHRTSLLRLHGYFGPVYLLQVGKNDDEECCFLK